MLKRVFLLSWVMSMLLSGALCATALASNYEPGKNEASAANLPPALLEDMQAWTASANFWPLIERGEKLAARVEIRAVKSNNLEAWLCGGMTVCLSTRLLREFKPETQQAVVAHEIGHLLIPRKAAAHPQLWETQCDLFAVALLRDAERVLRMLKLLAADCPECQDNQHPTPRARAALIECFSTTTMNKVLRYDEFLARSYAVQFKLGSVPPLLRRLSFAIHAAAVSVPSELAALRFPVQP